MMCSPATNPVTVPTIEFSDDTNLVPGSPRWLSTAQQVVRALEDYGCFVAVVTSNSADIFHRSIFRAAEELFDLPTEVKKSNTSDTPSHGYVGQIPLMPLYEGLGIEDSTTRRGVEKFTNLLWPSGNHHFCETSLDYSKAVAGLEQAVMRMVSESYGITESYEALLDKTSHLLRMMKYRAAADNENGGLGIVPHTDKSFMSVLHYEVPGLEIKPRDSEDWVVVDACSHSSFVVMAGDVCMAWTNGRIESSEHRVVMMKGSEERYSVGVFSFIRDAEIRVPEEVVDDEHPLQFKPFHHYKYLHFYHSEEGRTAKCPIKAYCGI